jgi:poly(3-hydroxybutyrate) depolymerase
MFTIEGEHDDITGLGHTRAAHELVTSLPADMRAHYLAPGVGHYGVFNGSRFRADIAPRVADFIASHRRDRTAVVPAEARRVATVPERAAMPKAAARA